MLFNQFMDEDGGGDDDEAYARQLQNEMFGGQNQNQNNNNLNMGADEGLNVR